MSKNKRLIAKIVDGENVIMTIDQNLLSVEFGALDRGNITDVLDWGIYANRGSISFVDVKGYFSQQNTNKSKFKNYIVEFYLIKSEDCSIIATFKIDEIEFDDETKRVDIQLISKLIDLQKYPTVSEYFGKYDVFTFYTASTKYLLGLSETETSPNYGADYPNYGLSLGEDTSRVSLTHIYCPYIEFGNVWDKMTKICQATMCRVVEDKCGNPIITGGHPTKDTIIVVNPKNILSISKPYYVKVDNPSIDLTNRIRHEGKNVSQISREFSVDLIEKEDAPSEWSMSGVQDYSFGEIVDGEGRAEFTYSTKSPYKIKGIPLVRRVETLDLEDSNGSKASMSVEEFFSGNGMVRGEHDELRLSDSFVFFREAGGIKYSVKSLAYSFDCSYFEDNGTQTIKKETDSSVSDSVIIPSNDFIQAESYFKHGGGEEIKLGEYILQETARRYSKGIECFEIECLFNDYVDENNNVVFNGNDLSQHFQKYDVIIPYVMKKGEKVPLRTDENNSPKKFRIIGISYSYDGLLKQKLSVQEERYDTD